MIWNEKIRFLLINETRGTVMPGRIEEELRWCKLNIDRKQDHSYVRYEKIRREPNDGR